MTQLNVVRSDQSADLQGTRKPAVTKGQKIEVRYSEATGFHVSGQDYFTGAHLVKTTAATTLDKTCSRTRI